MSRHKSKQCIPRLADKPKKPFEPGFYMPAMPPLQLISKLEHWWHLYSRRRQFRKRFLPLLNHSDHALERIGYQRSDILWALQLPLHTDALHALNKRLE